MGYERLAWIGNLLLAGIGIGLGWLPVSEQLGKWRGRSRSRFWS